jgi:aerobic carbon-monoxide dehydrogenase large subunit
VRHGAQVEVLHSDTHGVPYAQGSYGSRTFASRAPPSTWRPRPSSRRRARWARTCLACPEAMSSTWRGKVRVKADRPTRRKRCRTSGRRAGSRGACRPAWSPASRSTTYFNPADFSFPFGTHVAVVEIDEQTGQVERREVRGGGRRGDVANAKIVEGQMHGNIAFGMGPALVEGGVRRRGADALARLPRVRVRAAEPDAGLRARAHGHAPPRSTRWAPREPAT